MNKTLCRAHVSPMEMCTNPSSYKDGSTLPLHMPNLIMNQNTYFAIHLSLYSIIDQMWDRLIYHVLFSNIKLPRASNVPTRKWTEITGETFVIHMRLQVAFKDIKVGELLSTQIAGEVFIMSP